MRIYIYNEQKSLLRSRSQRLYTRTAHLTRELVPASRQGPFARAARPPRRVFWKSSLVGCYIYIHIHIHRRTIIFQRFFTLCIILCLFYQRRFPGAIYSRLPRRLATNNDPGYIKFRLVFPANYARNAVYKRRREGKCRLLIAYIYIVPLQRERERIRL